MMVNLEDALALHRASFAEMDKAEAAFAKSVARLYEAACSRFGPEQAREHVLYVLDGLLPYQPRPKPITKRVIPNALRKAVMERDGYRCVTCGDWHDLSIDHKHPESKGGETTLENLQVLCRSCNSRKGVKAS